MGGDGCCAALAGTALWSGVGLVAAEAQRSRAAGGCAPEPRSRPEASSIVSAGLGVSAGIELGPLAAAFVLGPGATYAGVA